MSLVECRPFKIQRGTGRARQLGTMLLGVPMEGIWHTGLVVFGKEYFYGGGIQCELPQAMESLYNLKPAREIPFGHTQKTEAEFQSYLTSVAPTFTEETYDVLNWNCNHFTNSCTQFLLNKDIPSEYLQQHEVLRASPMGNSILQMIQNMTSTIRNPVGAPPPGGLSSAPSEPLPKRTPVALPHASFCNALQQFLTSQPAAECRVGLEILEKIASNLLRNSTVLKYREVNGSSASLVNSLLKTQQGENCLIALGFQLTILPKEPVACEPTASDAQPVECTTSLEQSKKKYVFHPVNRETLCQLQGNKTFLQRLMEGLGPHIDQLNKNPVPLGMVQSLMTCIREETSNQNVPSASISNFSNGADTYPEQMRHLIAMGFTNSEACLRALRNHQGNLNRALDELMGER